MSLFCCAAPVLSVLSGNRPFLVLLRPVLLPDKYPPIGGFTVKGGVEYFDAAERAGYRVGWEHPQNLTLFHRELPAGGWNSSARRWYLAVRFVRGANEALFERHHFVLRPRGRDREICTLSDAENLAHFEAAIEMVTGGRVRPREAPR